MKKFEGDWAVELARQKIASVARKLTELDDDDADTLLEVLDQLNSNAAEELQLVGKTKQFNQTNWVEEYIREKNANG